MIHARSDYNRIQDPAANPELLDAYRRACAVVKDATYSARKTREYAALDALTAALFATLDVFNMGTPAHPIGADEPVFLLRARDKYAPETVSKWAELVYDRGQGDGELSMRANNHARAMLDWQEANGSKIPDAPADARASVDDPPAETPSKIRGMTPAQWAAAFDPIPVEATPKPVDPRTATEIMTERQDARAAELDKRKDAQWRHGEPVNRSRRVSITVPSGLVGMRQTYEIDAHLLAAGALRQDVDGVTWRSDGEWWHVAETQSTERFSIRVADNRGTDRMTFAHSYTNGTTMQDTEGRSWFALDGVWRPAKEAAEPVNESQKKDDQGEQNARPVCVDVDMQGRQIRLDARSVQGGTVVFDVNRKAWTAIEGRWMDITLPEKSATTAATETPAPAPQPVEPEVITVSSAMFDATATVNLYERNAELGAAPVARVDLGVFTWLRQFALVYFDLSGRDANAGFRLVDGVTAETIRRFIAEFTPNPNSVEPFRFGSDRRQVP